MQRTVGAVFFSGIIIASVLPLFSGALEVGRDTVGDVRASIRAETTARGPAAAGEVIVKFKHAEQFTVESAGDQRVEEAVRRFAARSDVQYAEPNYLVEAFATPNDPYYVYQWNFQTLNMPTAWDTTNGSGVIVAVIDSGVAYENYTQGSQHFALAPDLAGTQFVAGYDFVNNDAHANDDNGHGTHVTGTIAGSTNNNDGVAGIAHGATIMPIKALNASGSGTHAAIANGIRFAADHGAKIINLSLGGSSGSQTLEDALKYAHDKGVTIVAASGNNGTGTVSYPAAYNAYVIAVGATRYDNKRSSYSNYGSALDIVAPGGDTSVDQNSDGYGDGILQQTFSNGQYGTFGYYFLQGTSMASPHVAGVAALLIAHGTATSPADIQNVLQQTANDLGTAGRDNTYGYGLVDPVAALAWNADPLPVVEPPVGDPIVPSELVVFSDSFEVSEWNGLWTEDAQNDWQRSNQRATDGTRSAEIDGTANNAALISIPIDLQGKTSATVSFSWFIENSLDTNEYVAFDISTNGGTTWTEKARIRGNVDQENVWQNVSVALQNINNLRLRFRGKMSDSSEDANLDMVKVIAE